MFFSKKKNVEFVNRQRQVDSSILTFSHCRWVSAKSHCSENISVFSGQSSAIFCLYMRTWWNWMKQRKTMEVLTHLEKVGSFGAFFVVPFPICEGIRVTFHCVYGWRRHFLFVNCSSSFCYSIDGFVENNKSEKLIYPLPQPQNLIQATKISNLAWVGSGPVWNGSGEPETGGFQVKGNPHRRRIGTSRIQWTNCHTFQWAIRLLNSARMRIRLRCGQAFIQRFWRLRSIVCSSDWQNKGQKMENIYLILLILDFSKVVCAEKNKTILRSFQSSESLLTLGSSLPDDIYVYRWVPLDPNKQNTKWESLIQANFKLSAVRIFCDFDLSCLD